jgi:hypothetical protein
MGGRPLPATEATLAPEPSADTLVGEIRRHGDPQIQGGATGPGGRSIGP